MNLSESMEMYLETIYLLERDHSHAHVVDIAERLEKTKPSVTKAMNQLKKECLINKEAYGHITLTEKGRDISRKIFARHNLISGFLEKSLNLSAKDAADNACKMEHVITDEMLDAIMTYLAKAEQGAEQEGQSLLTNNVAKPKME